VGFLKWLCYNGGMDPSYNNSFGSSQGPITSGTGDIVLASSGGKKSKKGLIIGILVAVVLVVVGVVVGVMMGVRQNSGNNFDATRRYANYVLTGDINDGNIGSDYSKNRIYYVSEVFYNGSDADFEDFYQGANGLIDVAISSVSEDLEKSILNEQKKILEMLKMYRDFTQYNLEKLATEYVEGQYVETQKNIEAKLELLKGVADGYTVSFVENMKKMIALVPDMMDIYYNAGCGGDTLEEMSKCELSEQSKAEFSRLQDDYQMVYDNYEYSVTAALPYYVKMVYSALDDRSGDNDA